TISATSSTGFTEAAAGSALELSDTGTVSFDDVDTSDLVDISFAANRDIAWTDGDLETQAPGLAALLVAGFNTFAADAAAPGSTAWTYGVARANLDFLAEGETITFSYTVTATDSAGATADTVVSFTITGANDAPTITATSSTGFTEVTGDSTAQALSDNGTVSFDDVDATDVIDISFAANGDIAWSGGDLDTAAPGLAALLVGGFATSATDAAAPGSTAW